MSRIIRVERCAECISRVDQSSYKTRRVGCGEIEIRSVESPYCLAMEKYIDPRVKTFPKFCPLEEEKK